ncbi:hypothetical protein [Planctomycetes bacterium K23_9]|uniref:hypothetical protein n=1 Tax=Stieleria marina TaxID=1930275 RepID=UPI0011A9C354
MKFRPQYELIFVLESRLAAALMDSASKHFAAGSTEQMICDHYYESPQRKKRLRAKSPSRQYRVRQIDSAPNVPAPYASLEALRLERGMRLLRQSNVPSHELSKLKSAAVDKSWAGKWFHKKLLKHSLLPSLEIQFDQTSWEADSFDGTLRLSVSRNIQAAPFQSASSSRVRIAANIVRMQFSVSLPSVLKSLIYEFALLPDQSTALLDLARAEVASVVDDEATANSFQAKETHAFRVNEIQDFHQEAATCPLG